MFNFSRKKKGRSWKMARSKGYFGLCMNNLSLIVFHFDNINALYQYRSLNGVGIIRTETNVTTVKSITRDDPVEKQLSVAQLRVLPT